MGGGDGDRLYGGNGDDELYGENGRDTLNGGNGSDILYGGNHTDTLNGGNGNDRLYGENARDFLNGDRGNDILLGGRGNDDLREGSGHGAMFGGKGRDELNAGSGFDSVYFHASEANLPDVLNPSGFNLQDATINLRNGAAGQHQHPNTGTTNFTAGRWADEDVAALAKGLQPLVDRTGGTTLLKKANGDSVTYIRIGDLSDGDEEEGMAGGWNGGGNITIQNGWFSADGINLGGLWHELGHNWDQPSETRFARHLRDVSSWRTRDGTGYIQSPAGVAWYFLERPDVQFHGFANEYGQNSPMEDFATSFENYLLLNEGELNESQATALLGRSAERLNVINAFFASL